MGPITLFDKSFLQMLNLDESSIFDALYSAVICPIFYTEVLADLSQQPTGEKTIEHVVADLARKTPEMHSTPNMMHVSICLAELTGQRIDMRHVPVKAGGRPVRHSSGVGVVFEEAPESRAFSRWQQQRFFEVEKDFAKDWRALLQKADHALTARFAKQVLAIHDTPKSLEEAMAIAKEVVHGEGQQFYSLKVAYALLGLPPAEFPRIRARWIKMGRRRLTEFAPYTAYCLLVDVFFHVAVDKKLISPDRASNKIDIAYLYYLPFAMLFVSNDKLHRRVAPLFMDERQKFVVGAELKDDLAALDAYYWNLPEDQRAQGLFRLASYPPNDDSFLTTRLWKHFGMRTERPKVDENPTAMPKETVEKLLQRVKEMRELAKRPTGNFTREEFTDPDHMIVGRRVPISRGKWRLMPPGVEADADGND